MARKLRYQPENVCYHVVTRIAHREFFFDDAEKDIIAGLIANVERFTGVRVVAYAIMSNHIHLLLFIDKPATLQAWEDAGYFLGYDFDKFREGNLYKVSELNTFTQAEVDEFRRLHATPVLERYEMSREELVARLKTVMRPKPFEDLMAKWEKLSEEELEDEYGRHLSRMYDLSAFMKILKQDITQYYNLRKHHTGGLWEGRFKDSIIERAVDAMSSVATYIDLNAWRAKICTDPSEYKWCSWAAALEGDPIRKSGYNFIYDTSSDWQTVSRIHRQQLEHRMTADTAKAAELEEAVFTSGAIIGSESFVNKVVGMEEEAFPAGHKTPPVEFRVGGVILRSLRNLSILRKKG